MRLRRLVLLLSSVPLLGQPKVEILWDHYGVAHVYAKNLEGLFFGYGYASMQSHGDLILKLYGESRGRAAEYWGAGANDENLKQDRWVRVNGVPERGEEWYRGQSPEYKKYLDAWADGMNEYAKRHPEALSEERKRVLPVTGADGVIHTHRVMHFNYLTSAAAVESAVTGKVPAPGGIGSNAWAIAPKKSASGRAMILMNPHLPWRDWYTYYEIDLNAPGIHLYGASQVGFPMLRFVFSDYLAFTQTVNSIDANDLYKLDVRGNCYMFDGACKAFETHETTVKVRGGADEPLHIRSSVHGPVVWDKDGTVVAQRTAGLDRPFAIEQYWKMALAHTFAEYEAQLRRLQVPTFNITYADRGGHIMYLFNGTLPVRSEGDSEFWHGVVDGTTSKTLWTKIHSYDDLPKLIDPATGFVQNTNDPPWTSTYPTMLQPDKFPAYTSAARTELWRTTRSLRMLTENPTISFDELKELKHSSRLEMADRVVDELVRAAEQSNSEKAKHAGAVLKAWDRQTEADSRGALLFETIAPKLRFQTPLDLLRPFDTPRGLKQTPAELTELLERAADDAERSYGAIDAPWGDWRRLKLRTLDLPANGGPGALGAFRVFNFLPATAAKRNAFMGDTFVCLVEFGTPTRARAVTSYGNSSQSGSPHAIDQLPLVAKKEMRTVLLTRKDVEANLESKDSFE
jgi:acyl-homoserine-lactone acylase